MLTGWYKWIGLGIAAALAITGGVLLAYATQPTVPTPKLNIVTPTPHPDRPRNSPKPTVAPSSDPAPEDSEPEEHDNSEHGNSDSAPGHSGNPGNSGNSGEPKPDPEPEPEPTQPPEPTETPAPSGVTE